MSRIGRKPINIPAGVDVSLASGNTLTVKGPKGELVQTFHPDMEIKVDGSVVNVLEDNAETARKEVDNIRLS